MDLVPGRARHPVPSGDEDLVAAAIALKRHRGLMRLPPVRFHHDSLLLPEEVDHQPLFAEAKRPVADRAGKTHGQQSWQHECLEITAHVRDGAVLAAPRLEDRPQVGDPVPPFGSGHGSVERIEVQPLLDRRSLYCSAHRVRPQHPREIDQRPGGTGDRQSSAEADFLRRRVAAAPAADPVEFAPGLAPSGHVDQHRPLIADPPERGGGSVREDRSVSAGK
jgi:hypothetical protein